MTDQETVMAKKEDQDRSKVRVRFDSCRHLRVLPRSLIRSGVARCEVCRTNRRVEDVKPV